MRYLFIGGCGRSGTSFVQKIFISHSEIIGGPEFDFLQPLLLTYRRMITPFHLKRQEFFYDKDSLDTYIKTFIDSCLLNKHKETEGVRFFSEKTPNNIDVAEHLLTLYPDSVFLNVIRDGRDVLLSHFEVEERYIQSGTSYNKTLFELGEVCNLWNKSIDAYFELIQKPNLKGRVVNVFYEKLLSNPKEELDRICKEIGIQFEHEMLMAPQNKVEQTPLKVDNIWHTNDMLNADFDTSKIGRWEKKLGYFQKTKANKLMGQNLKKLNYLK